VTKRKKRKDFIFFIEDVSVYAPVSG